MIFQLIVTYSLVGWALYKVVRGLIDGFRPGKEAGCAGGCASCRAKDELKIQMKPPVNDSLKSLRFVKPH